MLNDQLFKTSAVRSFENWLIGSEKFSAISRNRPLERHRVPLLLPADSLVIRLKRIFLCSITYCFALQSQTLAANLQHLSPRKDIYKCNTLLIAHFRVSLGLSFKTSLSAKSLLWKSVFIHIETTTNYHYKNFALRLAFKERPTGNRKWSIIYSYFRSTLTWSAFDVILSMCLRYCRREVCFTSMRSKQPSARWALGDKPSGLLAHAHEMFAPMTLINLPFIDCQLEAGNK